jgi:hypothetical protein
MKILIGCEESATVREAFNAAGHDAWSCDLLPSRIPGQHIQADILTVLDAGWDMAIFHTPCTYLCNSGVCWLHKRPERWELMRKDAVLFKTCMDADIPKIAMENPIPHKYALEIIGRKYDQIIQPWMFGHPESKQTCLWLKGLPLLTETNNVKAEMDALPKNQQQRLHYLPPGPERARERSKTFSGVALAFAAQWDAV